MQGHPPLFGLPAQHTSPSPRIPTPNHESKEHFVWIATLLPIKP